MASKGRYWLVKSEPTSFSIQDLAQAPQQTTDWSGVRNYQARNYLREMKAGDQVLFHHSGANPPAIVGVTTVAREAYPDPTAQDPKDGHYDPAASPENPIWLMVDLRLKNVFDEPIPLDTLRQQPALKNMELLRKGSRLSVQPVTEAEFQAVLKLAGVPWTREEFAAAVDLAVEPPAASEAGKRSASKKPVAKEPAAKKSTAKKSKAR